MAAFSSQKYAACILLTLIVAISQPADVAGAYTMQETCSYFSEGYIGDPSNCQGWGYCKGGLLVKSGLCATGLLYDSALGMCNYAKDVTCTTTLANVCQNLGDPGYVGDPNNCQRYAYCSNGNILNSFSCPTNQVFNSVTNSCIWSSSPQNTCSANSICRLVQNNKFVGDPQNCGNYIRCQNGAGVRGTNNQISQQCPSGTLFNPIGGGCDANYRCNTQPGVPGSPTQPNVPSTNSTLCAIYYNTATAGTQYFSDDMTCYGYYICTSTGTATWGSCPFALHFNGTDCVTPFTYACPYNRCGNLDLGFVAQLGCQDYTICSNQRDVGSGSCADSNPDFIYFNEVGQGCVNTLPAQAICTDTDYYTPNLTTNAK